ncbi:MAG: succinyl-CoA--3-ketoacid-CoA transferase, partial [Desulfuromonadales bacterium]|nr:succinyl-CoA--3-ketoacid-CoA transferase [Desulfuromonadales bacterium]NIR33130.1 succinyl-CoA--3-ketoacid-CoA transferase [Desulfuromonadales bacterium]NIS41427.1 succinyl-CoA--3-ketoacid-CoA transferase [Desulfuromonadales bacterium]
LLPACTLPITARACVDTLITERAVFRKRDGRLRLTSVHPGYTPESIVQGLDASIEVAGELEPWKEVAP